MRRRIIRAGGRIFCFIECLTPENPRGVGAKGRRAVRAFCRIRWCTRRRLPKRKRRDNLEYVPTAIWSATAGLCWRKLRTGDYDGGTEVTLYWNVDTKGRVAEPVGAAVEMAVRVESQLCDAPWRARIGAVAGEWWRLVSEMFFRGHRPRLQVSENRKIFSMAELPLEIDCRAVKEKLDEGAICCSSIAARPMNTQRPISPKRNCCR